MPVQIKNTANDRNKAHLHRVASKITYEPSIGGVRLRLGETMTITDDQYDRLKDMLKGWEAKGMIEILDAPDKPKESSEDSKPAEEAISTAPPEAAPLTVHQETTAPARVDDSEWRTERAPTLDESPALPPIPTPGRGSTHDDSSPEHPPEHHHHKKGSKKKLF